MILFFCKNELFPLLTNELFPKLSFSKTSLIVLNVNTSSLLMFGNTYISKMLCNNSVGTCHLHSPITCSMSNYLDFLPTYFTVIHTHHRHLMHTLFAVFFFPTLFGFELKEF